MRLLESVPNVSEGRDAAVVDAVGRAFASAGARLLDTHVDPDHHRSVFTLVGDDRALEDGLVAGVAAARERSTCAATTASTRASGLPTSSRRAARTGTMPGAPRWSRAPSRARLGDELGLPVFLYGAIGDGRRPAFFRRGGPASCSDASTPASSCLPSGRRGSTPGQGRCSSACGGRCRVQRRARTATLEVAGRSPRRCASRPAGSAACRRSGCGSRTVVQVSTNIVDLDATAPHVLVERIVRRGGGPRGARRPAASWWAACRRRASSPRRPRRASSSRSVPSGVPDATRALEAAARVLRLGRLERRSRAGVAHRSGEPAAHACRHEAGTTSSRVSRIA